MRWYGRGVEGASVFDLLRAFARKKCLVDLSARENEAVLSLKGEPFKTFFLQ